MSTEETKPYDERETKGFVQSIFRELKFKPFSPIHNKITLILLVLDRNALITK